MTLPALQLPPIHPVTDEELLICANYQGFLQIQEPSVTLHFDLLQHTLFRSDRFRVLVLCLGDWRTVVAFMRRELEQVNPQAWMREAQVGELALVIRQSRGRKLDGTWANIEVASAPIQRVTPTYIEAGGQRFKKAPNQKGYGGARQSTLLRPLSDEQYWKLKARLHAAFNAFCLERTKDALTSDLLSLIYRTATDKLHDGNFIRSLELVLEQRQDTQDLIRSINAELKAASKSVSLPR